MYVSAVGYLAHLLSDISRHWVLATFAFVILAPLAWAGIMWIGGRQRRRRIIDTAVAENLKAPTSFLQATQRVGFKKSRRGAGLFSAGLLGLVLFGLFGEWLTSPLVYQYGETGEGVVTGEYRTADMWNNQPVLRFDALIRKADGGIVRTSFRTDSFNVYPAANSVRYPPVGVRFRVRYLPVHPSDFVIVTNDDSEWARSLRCGDLLGEVARAERELRFASGNPAFVRARDAALTAARAGGCIPGTN